MALPATAARLLAPSPSRRAGRPPVVLWVVALALLVPVAAPLVHLFLRATGPRALRTLLSLRTAELALNTALLTLAVTGSAVLVGVATAWLTTRTDLPGRKVWSTLCPLPLVVPSFVGGLALISALGPRGLLADLLTPLGVERIPSIAGFPGAWLALTLFTYPYVHLVASAALRSLDPVLEEAARGLGSPPWRAFRSIALPQLRPSLGVGAVLAALYTLSDFGAVSLLRYDALTRAIYAQYQGRLDRSPAAALAAVLVLMAVVVLVVESRTRSRRGVYYSRRPARPIHLVPLTRPLRVGALAFLSGLLGLALVVPSAVLTFWLVRGLRHGEPLRLVWTAAAGSLGASAAAAVVAVLAAVPVALLVVRHRSRASAALDRAFYVVYALPHIAVGLALVFFAANFVPFLYQTLALLVLTYVAVFLPQATGAGRAALVRVNPHLEEAARGLGKGPLQALLRITVPLMSRGLLAGGALVFLTSMKELPATLLLRPTGFDTLAVQSWAAANEAFFARAAAPALLLLAVALVPTYLLASRGYATEL